MSSLLLEGPISPELVLIADPEEAREAREALPDVEEFYEWIRGLREVISDETTVEPEETHGRSGFVLFTLLGLLNALVPFSLVVWHSVT